LDKSNVQQFASNMNANAVNRAARLKTAIEKQDQAGINANQPYTAEEVLKAWAEYERTPPGGERQSSLERLRHEAAWKAWVLILTEHNKSVRDGTGPVIPTDKVGKAYALIRKGDIDKPGQAKETAEAWAKRKQAYIERLLTVPWMADRIQAQLDLLTAEAEANKAKAAQADAAPASTDELF
jgi:hypothetical protein